VKKFGIYRFFVQISHKILIKKSFYYYLISYDCEWLKKFINKNISGKYRNCTRPAAHRPNFAPGFLRRRLLRHRIAPPIFTQIISNIYFLPTFTNSLIERVICIK
jgi:hypothetical protein